MRFPAFPAQVLCLALALTFLLGVKPTAANAQEAKLNQQLTATQSITVYKVSPDGKYAVYEVDQIEGYSISSRQLFSVNTATREIKALTPALTGDKSIREFQISPNSNRVVVFTDALTLYQYELFSVAITGGSATKISRSLPANGNGSLTNFKISPDGSRVAYGYYEYSESGDSINALYSNSITGGSNTRLSSNAPGASFNNYLFAPDSRRIVFEYSPTSGGDSKIYSVPATGGAPVVVAAKYYGDYYQVTADSQTLVFVADFEGDYVNELYSAPVTGGARTKLSLSGEDVSNFRLANPYSAAVYAYKMTNEGGYAPNSFGIVGTDARNRYALATGKDINSDFVVTPDNRGIVFTASDASNNYQNELYSITLDSRGQTRKLSDLPATRGVGDFKVSPDGSRVVYSAYPLGYGGLQLFSVPTIDGGAVKLSNVPSGDINAAVNSYQFTPDGKRVVFAYSAQNTAEGSGGGYDLLVNSVTGGTPRKAAANVNNGYNSGYVVATNTRVVFSRTFYALSPDGYQTSKTELYAAIIPQ